MLLKSSPDTLTSIYHNIISFPGSFILHPTAAETLEFQGSFLLALLPTNQPTNIQYPTSLCTK